MNPLREKFITEARGFLGCAWRHQGRTKQGIDCVGLIVVPLLALGLFKPEDDVVNYTREPEGRRLTEILHQYARRLSGLDKAQPGDLIAMRFTSEPQHLAIITRINQHGPHILHAAGQGRAVVEHHLDKAWLGSHRAKIHAAYAIKAFDDQNQENQLEDSAPGGCGCGS
jgi:cell wall-associated NlpC family hydrolase